MIQGQALKGPFLRQVSLCPYNPPHTLTGWDRASAHPSLSPALPRSLPTGVCTSSAGSWRAKQGGGRVQGQDEKPSGPQAFRPDSLLVAYFSLQVISARRAFRVSPPLTTGPPEFERIYRAQVNCSEYFPLFLAALWVAGVFFHEGAAALCGLAYLFARLRYFQGYARSAQLR
nr:leukotriene C4 synthase isoform X2 [Microcebus murinus]